MSDSVQRPDDALLSYREVAAHIGVPVETLKFWRKTGNGPVGYRIGPGHQVRFRWSDVERWLEAGREPEVRLR